MNVATVREEGVQGDKEATQGELFDMEAHFAVADEQWHHSHTYMQTYTHTNIPTYIHTYTLMADLWPQDQAFTKPNACFESNSANLFRLAPGPGTGTG